jgi:GT2 family glycosyltransferase
MELAVFLQEILFVIVLYKKKPEQSPSLSTVLKLARQLQTGLSVFVYDNSPERSTISDSSVIYRHDSSNGGLGKAYNEASSLAAALNKKWMHLLDQDTVTTVTFYHKLFDAVTRRPDSVAFVPRLYDAEGYISPFRWQWGKGKRITANHATLPLLTYRFVNSGLLIRHDTFQQAKGYHGKIPLDFSDIAFGEKLQKLVPVFSVVDESLQHDLSGSSHGSWRTSLERFHFFCLGAFTMGREYGPFYLYFARTMLRAVYLSLRYKRAGFIRTFFRHAMKTTDA